MLDLTNETNEQISDLGKEFRDFGDVVALQYENKELNAQLSDLKANVAFQNSGNPYDLYVQLYFEASEQYFTDLQGWLTGFTTSALMGDFTYIGPGNFPPVMQIPDFPVITQHPEVAAPMEELHDLLVELPTAVTDLNEAGEGGIVGLIREIQTIINNVLESLIKLFGADSGEGTNEYAEAYYEGVAAEALGLVFTPEVIENWGNLTVAEREVYIAASVYVLNQALGLDVANVSFEDAPFGTAGYFRGFDNTIGISRWMYDGSQNGVKTELEQLGTLIDTIVHEVKHQFHHEYLADPESFPVQFPPEIVDAWRENYDNYISPMDDLIGYMNQPLETSTNKFAEAVMIQAGLGLLWQLQNDFWNN
jgi:hypothetical protein